MSGRRLKSVRYLLVFLFLGSWALIMCLGQSPSTLLLQGERVAIAQMPESSQLVQRGVEQYQLGNWQQAINSWQAALEFYREMPNRANEVIVLENLARAYQQIGQLEEAISYWEQAIAIHRQLGHSQQVGRALTEQAQAYSRIGQHRQAVALLCGQLRQSRDCESGSAVQIARELGDRAGEAAALGSLGEAERLRGNFQKAVESLQGSLDIATQIDALPYRIAATNSLGNTYNNLARGNERRADAAEQIGEPTARFRREATRDNSRALTYFQQSFELARDPNNPQGMMRSLLNSIPLYSRLGDEPGATQARQQALSLLERLPQTREKVYAAIDLAKLLQPEAVFPSQCLAPERRPQGQQLLRRAVAISQGLEDNRALSFALGELGHIYECDRDYEQALELTQQARWTAEQDLQSRDSLYRWEWQSARILKALGKAREARGAYRQAIATLETIRDELLTANRDLQFDFRDVVEPIYRESIALELDAVPPSLLLAASDAETVQVVSILETADSLRLAELQNYFGSDCELRGLESPSAETASADPSAAIFSSIILDDRTAIIVSFPSGQQKVVWLERDRQSFQEEIARYRFNLESYFEDYDFDRGRQVYDWLIRPFETDLEREGIETLVFVQDGILRSIPMSALYDGEGFLIQKYAIATTPSLSLTDPNSSNREQLRALALGLSKSATVGNREFIPLPFVRQEIDRVREQLPGSKPLLDEEFTRDSLQQELRENDYPVLHIATHGVFGIVPEDTYLVTGNDEKLTLSELDTLIRTTSRRTEPIELLTLTACQTAIGDDRSALGLAGVAVQAGARSALASLWAIEDAATAQIAAQFYRELTTEGTSKAQALQKAQIALIEEGRYAHPAYWAPFILIGNWL